MKCLLRLFKKNHEGYNKHILAELVIIPLAYVGICVYTLHDNNNIMETMVMADRFELFHLSLLRRDQLDIEGQEFKDYSRILGLY